MKMFNKTQGWIAMFILCMANVSFSQNRLLIDTQIEQSVFPYSTIVTDGSNNLQFVVPGAEGTHFTIVGGVPTWTVSSGFTDNIYTADGNLSADRVVDTGLFDLKFATNVSTRTVVIDGGLGMVSIGGVAGVPDATLHVFGSGNTKASVALLIEDNGGVDHFSFMGNGELRIGNGSTDFRPIVYPFSGSNETTINTSGFGLGFYAYISTENSATSFSFSGDPLDPTAGTQRNVFLDRSFPADNTAAGFINLNVHTTVNQINGANGKVRGVYVESTLTSAADYMAIETEEGLTYLAGSIGFKEVLSPAQITLNQDDYAPTGWDDCYALRLSTDASRNITGFSNNDINDWEIREIWNIGSFDIVLKHQDAGSQLNQRIICPGGVDATVTHYAKLVYDGSSNDWRILFFL